MLPIPMPCFFAIQSVISDLWPLKRPSLVTDRQTDRLTDRSTDRHNEYCNPVHALGLITRERKAKVIMYHQYF